MGAPPVYGQNMHDEFQLDLVAIAEVRASFALASLLW
jgi:hypothetical protein